MGPEVWLILLLLVIVAAPIFIGVIAFINRATTKKQMRS